MRVSFGDCVVDLERRQLFRHDRDVHLTPKAFDLLALLVAARPRAIAKAEIHDRLWPGTFVTESNLTTLVTELRAALGDSARSPRYVKTVPRFGYAFCASATEVVEPPPGRRRRARHFTLSWDGGQVALHDGENVIGREEDAAAWIESASVSRRHARIVISEGTATLEDLGSKNGTTYRGQRITSPVVLTSDEVIVVGLVPLRFRSSQGAPSTRTVAKR
jgi:DNA-binding winged helix-turn-helix (wHTH) protein